jgi:uroporphyrinogen III methyltransferase/synthase
MPAVEILPPEDSGTLSMAAGRAGRGAFDWIVFTSAKGVEAFAEALAANGVESFSARLATIGPATADAAARRGWQVDLVPEVHTSEGLLRALIQSGSLERASVLLPVAARARDVLPAGLRGQGALVEVVVAYRTVAADDTDPELVQLLLRPGAAAAVTFASPSAVEGCVERIGPAILSLPAVVIGPVTGEAAQRAGFSVVKVAEPHTNLGLAHAVKSWLDGEGRR